MNKPGKNAYHHACLKYPLPLKSIAPQEASGGCVPNPRKLSAASTKIAKATAIVICTRIGPIQLGNIVTKMTRLSLAPIETAAST